MFRNELKLNHYEIEIVHIFLTYGNCPLFIDFNMGNAGLTTTASKARSLRVVFDDNILFNAHVSTCADHPFTSSDKIRKYLTQMSSEIAVHAFITSNTD